MGGWEILLMLVGAGFPLTFAAGFCCGTRYMRNLYIDW